METDASKTSGQRLSPSEKVEIMLHEYDSLREEVVQNLGWRAGLLAVAASILVPATGYVIYTGKHELLVVVPFALLFFCSWMAMLASSVLTLSTYLGVLEEQINGIAGSPLLMWEHGLATRWKIGTAGGKKLRLTYLHSLYTALGSLLTATVFVYTLCRGGEYIYMNLHVETPIRVAAVTAYEVVHVTILAFILYGVLGRNRILSAYRETVRKERALGQDTSH